MKTRLASLLALVSLCTLLALPAPALAAPKDDDVRGTIPISDISAYLQEDRISGSCTILWVELTFMCQVNGPYRLDIDLSQEGTNKDVHTVNGDCYAAQEETLYVRINLGQVRFEPGSIEVTVEVTQDRGDFLGIARTNVHWR